MKDHVSFSFDRLDILGVFDDDVHVRGRHDSEDCVIVLNRELFHQALDVWLTNKQLICTRYEHYCGAMGSIMSKNKLRDVGEVDVFLITTTGYSDQELEYIYTKVKMYRISAIEKTADMEHG